MQTLAGFPLCAKPEALAKLVKTLRLPEFEAGEVSLSGSHRTARRKGIREPLIAPAQAWGDAI